ncbi:hypothetical protein [Abyssisolibacter fermentans]|uniref:hypothetical protein n=1 Tax=Abyssisolibacter fermentans TaxID=1766203 RepID=UPI00082BB424|nr:hypothetical protein [Abyssisolibacter fermentans]
MSENRLLLILSSIKKKELTEEEFLREAESNGLVAGIVDILLGTVIYFSLLGLLKTLLFGELFYTGPLIDSSDYYCKYYMSKIKGIEVTSEIVEKVSFDITIIPLGVVIIIGLMIFYYCALSRKLKILTLGEILVGGKLNAHKYKVWENNHLVNRGGLYTVAILNLLILTYAFRGALEGNNVYSITNLGIKYLILLLCVFGLYALGKGSLIVGELLLIASNIIAYIQSSKLGAIIVEIHRGRFFYPENRLSKMFFYMLFIIAIVFIITFTNKLIVKRRLKISEDRQDLV